MPESVGTETFRNEKGQAETRRTGYAQKAVDQADRQDAARSRMGAMGSGGDDMPKQEPGESPAKFGTRMREWRERKARGGAVKEMLKR